jgi:hypothetical protein
LKPYVAIFHKYYDAEDELMKPKLTMLIPQSLKHIDLPLKELETLFTTIFAIGKDSFDYEKTDVSSEGFSF